MDVPASVHNLSRSGTDPALIEGDRSGSSNTWFLAEADSLSNPYTDSPNEGASAQSRLLRPRHLKPDLEATKGKSKPIDLPHGFQLENNYMAI
jgi:hypothetical protein